LFGEDFGIASGFVGLLLDLARNLVLPVAVGHSAHEGCDEDEGTFAADGEDCVVEDALVPPLFKGLFLRFGEAEVGFCSPILFDSVELVGAEEFVSANDAELVIAIRGDRILAALAAGQGQLRSAHALAAALVGDHRAVFVIGMGDDHHQTGPGSEMFQALLESSGAAIFGQGQCNFGWFRRGRLGERLLRGLERVGRLDRGKKQSGNRHPHGYLMDCMRASLRRYHL